MDDGWGTVAAVTVGIGKLIRSGSDRGVVAVLDSRLANARYRWKLVRALPPFRRTTSLDDVEEFLTAIRDGSDAA